MVEPAHRLKRRSDRWILGWAAILAATLYVGTAIEPGAQPFARGPLGYYGLQTEGFRAGHLYASIAPHPALLALKDPYDPVANAPYRVHDMTLYHGHYYLYFGVSPILVVFWPVAALTGWYPSEPLVVVGFCTGAIWLGLGLLGAVRRRYFPDASAWMLGLGALCLVGANPMSRLVQGPLFYQVAISCAIFLQMAMIAALYRALHSPRGALGWLMLASVLYGLAVGARPNYLASGVAVAAAALVLARRVEPGRRWFRLVQALTAAALPAAAIGACLLLYNWLRFESPFEFGMRYQLAGETFLNLRPIQLKNIGPHLVAYLFQPGFWSVYFPFFDAPSGQPYGFLRYVLWGWLAPLALLSPRRGFIGILALASVGNLLLLASFFGTTDRYPGDYTTSWLLLSGIGALALSQRAVRAGWRAALHGLCGVLAAVSLFQALAAFTARAPAHFPLLAVSRVANWPAYAWRRAHGEADGALRVTLEVPAARPQRADPIFETGREAGERDWLELEYLAGERARLVFNHAGMNGFVGDSFPIPADRRLVIEVRCGSLLPPFAYPGFSGWTRDEFEAAKRDLQVTVNGVQRLRAVVYCYDSAPADLLVGRLAWFADGVAQTFSGRILASQRLPLKPFVPPPSRVRESRPVELRLSLPAQHEPGGDPLLVTGRGAQSDLLSCFYDGHGGIRFALDHYGAGGPQSETIRYDPMQIHRLTVWMGSLVGEAAATPLTTVTEEAGGVPWSHRLVVVFDGRTLLNVEQVFYPGAPATALIGINPYGSTTAGRQFQGRVDGVSQVGFGGLVPLAATGDYGAVDLSVQFPLYAIGTQEPLVVTGVSGAGDLIYVRYVDPRHVSIGFDHWGVGGFTGPPIELDYGQTHRVAITMGSLYPPGGDPGRATLVRVTIDGRVALEGHSAGHPSAPRQNRIGINPIGGSTCGPRFTGRILAIERTLEPRPWPPAVPGAAGAIELDLQFPAHVPGTREPLVVTGVAGAADLIYVRYVDSRHVSIGFDHWGVGGLTGPSLEVDYGQTHRLAIAMGSLYRPGSGGADRDPARATRVRVTVDGKVALEGSSPCHPATRQETRVGVNPLGGSTCGPAFTGRILSVSRVVETAR
jgi:hypothetical protein